MEWSQWTTGMIKTHTFGSFFNHVARSCDKIDAHHNKHNQSSQIMLTLQDKLSLALDFSYVIPLLRCIPGVSSSKMIGMLHPSQA